MEFTKLLEERRSIRAFDPEKHVTAEQIQEIVQAAIQAPSWKNSQTTRYYALVTPEKVEEFSAKCLPEFNQKSSKGAALVVTAFVKDRSGFTQDGTPDNEVGNGWGYYDLGLHDENLILRARELGLDTLIMGIRDEKAIREALSIPENELLGAVIAVGYRAVCLCAGICFSFGFNDGRSEIINLLTVNGKRSPLIILSIRFISHLKLLHLWTKIKYIT